MGGEFVAQGFPPPLIRGQAKGPPIQITTIGDARIERRRKFSEERAREEVCQVQPIQDKPPESIQGEVNTVMNVNTSKTTTAKGTGKGVPTPKAKPPIVLPEAKNANSQVKYLDEYFVRRGKNPFLLADAIPEPTKEESSNTSESRRGVRRPKEPPATQQTKWDGSSNWSSWNKWKE